MPPAKRPQQWQSFFGQDEIVSVTGINNSTWTDEDLKPNVVGVIVVPEPTEGIQVSLGEGTTFVQLVRSVKTGVEYDFQDRFPLATRGVDKISFRSVTTAGPHTIKLVKRYES